jgi:hypothetical protein
MAHRKDTAMATRPGIHVETRLIRPIFIAGAKHGGGTWRSKTHGRMMRQRVGNKGAHSKLDGNGAETKPPINSEPVTVLRSKTVTDRC